MSNLPVYLMLTNAHSLIAFQTDVLEAVYHQTEREKEMRKHNNRVEIFNLGKMLYSNYFLMFSFERVHLYTNVNEKR